MCGEHCVLICRRVPLLPCPEWHIMKAPRQLRGMHQIFIGQSSNRQVRAHMPEDWAQVLPNYDCIQKDCYTAINNIQLSSQLEFPIQQTITCLKQDFAFELWCSGYNRHLSTAEIGCQVYDINDFNECLG